MRMLLTTLTAVASIAGLVPASATTYTFTTLNVPGTPSGINNSGQIVGSSPSYYDDTTFQQVYSYGYELDSKTGTLTTFAVPGNTGTIPTAIDNSGRIGGYYYDTMISGPNIFLRDPSTGAFTLVEPFGRLAINTLSGLNDAGLIVGTEYYSRYSQGLLFDTSTSTLTTPFNFASAINNVGQAVGSGGLYDLNTGAITRLSYPDPSYTSGISLFGINNTGQIIGQAYRPSSNPLVGFESLSFVYDLSSKTYTPFADPDGTNTLVEAINDAGQIVGAYKDSSGTVQAFLATPNATTTVPEPASIALLGTALLGLARVRLRRTRTG